MILKSDGEPAIVAVRDALGKFSPTPLNSLTQQMQQNHKDYEAIIKNKFAEGSVAKTDFHSCCKHKLYIEHFGQLFVNNFSLSEFTFGGIFGTNLTLEVLEVRLNIDFFMA